MDKIKCVITKNGTIIPLHSITLISAKGRTPLIWTNCGDGYGGGYYELSDEQYDALLHEIEIIN